jgi:hypothetical protein
MRRSPLRNMGISLFFAALCFGNYTRLSGTECIRAIHIVTLITFGMFLGVALVFAVIAIRGKPNDQ